MCTALVSGRSRLRTATAMDPIRATSRTTTGIVVPILLAAFTLLSVGAPSSRARAATEATPIPLTWLPGDGFLIPSPEEFVRLEARNASSVHVRARWIREGEAPAVWGEEDRSRRNFAASHPADGAAEWILDEVWTPDSLSHATRDYLLASLPQRPSDVQGICLEANAGDEAGTDGRSPAATAILQFVSIGITAHLGTDSGLFWVTDLFDGKTIANADISLWGPEAPPSPTAATHVLWRGQTDEQGLAWAPGTEKLAPLGMPKLVRAVSDSRSAWLPLRLPQAASALPDSGDRVLLWVDRDVYGPEEPLRWQLFSVQRDGSALRWNPGESFLLRLDGPGSGDGQRFEEVRTDRSFEAHGSLPLPRTPGLYRIRATNEATGRESPARTLRIAEAAIPRLQVELTGPQGPLVGETRLSLEGSVQDGHGNGLGPVPTEWTVEVRPLADRSVATFPGFRFLDAGSDSASPAPRIELRPEEKTGDEGLARARVGIAPLNGATVPHTIRVRFHPQVRPDGGDAVQEWIWFPGPHRAGVRDASGDPKSRGALAWEWIVVDLQGNPVPDVPVRLELKRIDPGFEQVLWNKEGRSEAAPSRLALERPGAGDYTLRVVLDDGTSADGGPDPAPAPGAEPTFLRAASESGMLDLTLAGTPLAGAATLFVVERGDVLVARSETVPGSGHLELPLPPLPPPTARLHVTQVGSDPSRVRFEGGLRTRLPFFRSAESDVRSDTPRHRVEVQLTVPEVRIPGDSLEVSIALRTPEGTHPEGKVTLAISTLGSDANATTTGLPTYDPVAELFGDDPALPGNSELRDRLVRSGESIPAPTAERAPGVGAFASARDESARRADPDVTATEAASRSFAPAVFGPEQLVVWRPDLDIPAGSGVRFRLPVGGPAGPYRIRVLARTPDLRFGYAEQVIAPGSDPEFEVAEISRLRAGDRIEWPVRIRGSSAEKWTGRIDVDLRGATLVRSPGTVSLDPGETWNGVLGIQTGDPGGLGLTVRLLGENGKILRERSLQAVIERPTIERRTVRSGIASPGAEERLDLEDGNILGGDGIEIRLAPSYFLELVDPVSAFLDGGVPGVDREITRLAAAALASRYPNWFGVDEQTLRRICLESCGRLQAAGLPFGPGLPIPQTDLVPEETFVPFRQDARARWAATRAMEGGLPVPRAWKEQLDDAGLEYRRRVRENLAGPQLELAALHTWTDLLTAKEPPPNADLLWLLARETRLGENGRLWLALALHASETAGVTPALRPQIDAQFHNLLTEFEEAIGVETSAALANDSVTTSALLLELLAARAPSHRTVSVLLRGLLESRNRAGFFPDPVAGTWAVFAIADLLDKVESPERTRSAQVVIGASSAHDFRFDPSRPAVQSARFDLATLSRLRRHDPDSTELRVTLETDRAATLHYQIRTTENASALEAGASGSVRTSHTYRDAFEREIPLERRDGSIPRADLSGRLLVVELILDLPAPTGGLYVTDPLPPGAEFRGWIADAAAATSSSTAPTAAAAPDSGATSATVPPSATVTAVHEGGLEFFTGPLPAGRHVLRYGLLLTADGRFGLPGPWVRSLGTDPGEGRGPAVEMRVRR